MLIISGEEDAPRKYRQALTCGVHLAGTEQHATEIKLKTAVAVAGEASRQRGRRSIYSCRCDCRELPGAACIEEARQSAGGQYGAAGPRRYCWRPGR